MTGYKIKTKGYVVKDGKLVRKVTFLGGIKARKAARKPRVVSKAKAGGRTVMC